MVTVIHGANQYLQDEALRKLLADFQAKHGDSIERFDASEIESIDVLIDALRSISFLDPRKLLIIKNADQNSELTESIPLLLDSVADSTDVIFVLGGAKRSSLLKALKGAEMIDCSELQGTALQQWVTASAKDLGAKLPPALATYLIERVGEKQQLLHQEIKKLALQDGEITKELIDSLVEPTPQSKIFALLDALFNGDLQATLRLYEDQRKQGEEPQKILAMIVWQLEQLALVVFSEDTSPAALGRLGVSPYSARKLTALARRVNPTTLRGYISDLVEVDRASKTNADIESALSVYFSSLAR